VASVSSITQLLQPGLHRKKTLRSKKFAFLTGMSMWGTELLRFL
jgi:hypothetical protein